MVPSVGTYTPVKRLKNVVLPAPFGPINPINSPFSALRETFETADNPPKFFVKSFTSNKLILFLLSLFSSIYYLRMYQNGIPKFLTNHLDGKS